MRCTVAIFLTLLFASACTSDPVPRPSEGPATSPVANATGTLPAQPSASATSAPTSIEPLSEVALAPAFANLTVQQPTGMYQGPSGRFFVTEQPGRVLVLRDVAGGLETEVYLDITDRVNAGGFEEGLLGLALAPDFSQSGNFYVNYTASNPRRTVVSRFTGDPAEDFANATSEVVILEVEQPFANHNGGQIAFGPDGYLYIAMGDGGGGGDRLGNGQNLTTLLGKILRIDVATSGQSASYSIPADNPFAGQGANGVREEIWAYGLRNPWRFSFDPETGNLWVGDVGQSNREEIDLILAGANLGWNIMEGNLCFSSPDCDRSGLTLPVFDYERTDGNCSVTGGFVYRGDRIPSLNGAYVYGDFCSGRVWALRFDGGSVRENKLIATVEGSVSSFAVDSDGEIYVLTYDQAGAIFKLVPAD